MEKETKKTDEVKKEKLSPAATVLLTIPAVLGAIVLARLMYFFIAGV